MNHKINGYSCFEVIRNYQKLDDRLVVNYLDGSSFDYDLKDEDKILVLMEKQGLRYVREYDNMANYCVNMVSGSTGLILLLIGTLGWLKIKCTGDMLTNDELILVSGVGSVGVASEVILIRKMFFKLSYTIGLLEDKEKYSYYFKNKELLGDCISINDLDNYSLSYLRNMLKEDEDKYNFNAKILKKKR